MEGHLEAASLRTARRRLERRYRSVVSLEERAERRVLRRPIPAEALAVYMRQLAVLLGAGVTVPAALASLARGDNPALNRVMRQLSRHVREGASLSQAMRLHPQAFSPIFINLVEAGEVAGRLEQVLSKLADLQEKGVKTRKRLQATFTYPGVLCLTSLVVLSVFVLYVLPVLQPIFLSIGVELPLATRIILALGWFVRTPYVWVPALLLAAIGLAIAVVIFQQLWLTNQFRLWLSQALFRVPVLGSILEKSTLSRVLFTLAILLESGVPMGSAISVTEKVADNEVIGRGLGRARQAMMQGAGVFQALDLQGILPTMPLQMIKIGESSGTLDLMLRKVAQMYEEEVDLALGTLASALEPLVMVFMGAVVAFVTLASFLPMVRLLGEL
ncbi:MAG TPA: type II secretion system F family protein [Candidatus Nitrosotenuis sp.]|nr:type II secretion system F family protein [Candidatus Nitrosotenuis sp.]